MEAKWIVAVAIAIEWEMERIYQRFTGRIKELMERYESPLTEIDRELKVFESKVKEYLRKMGIDFCRKNCINLRRKGYAKHDGKYRK